MIFTQDHESIDKQSLIKQLAEEIVDSWEWEEAGYFRKLIILSRRFISVIWGAMPRLFLVILLAVIIAMPGISGSSGLPIWMGIAIALIWGFYEVFNKRKDRRRKNAFLDSFIQEMRLIDEFNVFVKSVVDEAHQKAEILLKRKESN